MRERAAATIFIWISLAVSTGLILNSLKYTEVDPTTMLAQTVLVPEQWQLGAAILIFVLILGAAGATTAIWQSTVGEHATRAHAEKAKRHHRDARIKRLLETLDDEDLDLLEGERMSGEEERLSLEALLRKRS
jgi:hypothetical protein